jgi:hypothetical protein
LIGNAEQIKNAKNYITDYFADFMSEERKYENLVNFSVCYFRYEGETKTILKILNGKHPDLKLLINWDESERAPIYEKPIEQIVTVAGNKEKIDAFFADLDDLIGSIVIEKIELTDSLKLQDVKKRIIEDFEVRLVDDSESFYSLCTIGPNAAQRITKAKEFIS